MLSDFITSSYIQYKADTNTVASWLATTAKNCGYASDLLQQNNQKQQPNQPSQRLKGKARKQAREAAKELGGNTTQQKLPTCTIPVQEFVSLAEYIAGYTKLPVSVPMSFVIALDRAISVRKEHGSYVSQLPEIANDQTRAIVITILLESWSM